MNILLDNFCYFWLAVSFFFLIAEMTNPGLFLFLSFFLGGLIAAGVTFFTSSFTAQSGIFLLGTTIFMILLRYFVLPILSKNRTHIQTNIFALKGKQGFVLKGITVHKMGIVKINGESWSARSVDDEGIDEGCTVEVIDVRGAHVVVKKI